MAPEVLVVVLGGHRPVRNTLDAYFSKEQGFSSFATVLRYATRH